MCHLSSKSSLLAKNNGAVGSVTSTSSTLVAISNAQFMKEPKSSSTPHDFLPIPLVHAANVALIIEWMLFAIDDAKDDEDKSDNKLDNTDDDDQVMDEVDTFLKAHDSGLTDADKEVTKDLLHTKPIQ